MRRPACSCACSGVTGRGARGFIPAGQTGTARGTDLRKNFKPGKVLDLKVLDLDPRRGEPKLSIRAPPKTKSAARTKSTAAAQSRRRLRHARAICSRN